MRSPRSLTGRAPFASVFARGRRATSDGLTVWALRGPGYTETRLGVAVGTRAGGAVERNRLRRRLRAAIRSLGLPAADVVVRADRSALQLSFQELEAHLATALRGAGALES